MPYMVCKAPFQPKGANGLLDIYSFQLPYYFSRGPLHLFEIKYIIFNLLFLRTTLFAKLQLFDITFEKWDCPGQKVLLKSS